MNSMPISIGHISNMSDVFQHFSTGKIIKHLWKIRHIAHQLFLCNIIGTIRKDFTIGWQYLRGQHLNQCDFPAPLWPTRPTNSPSNKRGPPKTVFVGIWYTFGLHNQIVRCRHNTLIQHQRKDTQIRKTAITGIYIIKLLFERGREEAMSAANNRAVSIASSDIMFCICDHKSKKRKQNFAYRILTKLRHVYLQRGRGSCVSNQRISVVVLANLQQQENQTVSSAMQNRYHL